MHIKNVIAIILLTLATGCILSGGLLFPLFYTKEEYINIFLSFSAIGFGIAVFGYYAYVSEVWCKVIRTSYTSEVQNNGVEFIKMVMVFVIMFSVIIAGLTSIEMTRDKWTTKPSVTEPEPSIDNSNDDLNDLIKSMKPSQG